MLFNMISPARKWLLTKVTSVLLIPFIIWFLLNFVLIFDNDYQKIAQNFSSFSHKILFSSFLIVAYIFFSLTISEIFEDYIQNKKIKNVANKLLITFAILIPFLTIWSIFSIKL